MDSVSKYDEDVSKQGRLVFTFFRNQTLASLEGRENIS